MKNKCSVVVNSCDAFEDLWEPFFVLLKHNWKNCPYDIYLNTEKRKYEDADGKVKSICHESEIAWSDRLISTLKRVNSQYVILLLDDFLVDGNVNQNMIDRCIEYLDKDRKIACFSFYPSKWRDIDNGKYPGFELRPTCGEYRFNMQAALWRKRDLLHILAKNETPWQTEERGTFRARVLMPKREFYAIKKDEDLPFFYEYGGAIHRGMWTEDTPALLEKYGIKGINFDIRGIDPRPTSDWAKMELGKEADIPKKKKIRIVIGEYLLAKGILKWKERS